MSEYRQAFCPMCHTAHGKVASYRDPERRYIKGDMENFWERARDMGPSENLGMIQDVSGGRGKGFQLVGYFGPDDDPDGYYPLIKECLLQVIRQWIENGWLTKDELVL